MKKLDAYIVKKFLGTFFFILALLMLIAVVFDVSERIDDFLKTQPPLYNIIVDYYQNFIYFYSNIFSFLIIFIAVIWFTSKMAQNSEIIAILSSGVSFPRFLFPYFIGATILTAISLYTNHYVLPHANKKMIDFEAKYVWNKASYEKIHRELKPGTIAYFRYNEGDTLYDFWMEQWENRELKSILYAGKAWRDTTTQKWKLTVFFMRKLGKEDDQIYMKPVIDTVLGFKLDDFGRRNEYASTMPTKQLSAYIEEERQKGNENIVNYEIEMHKRTANPVATYILTLIAVCVASRRNKGGMGMNIFVGLLIAVSYIFCMQVTSVAATNAGLNPLLAVWLPNMVFAVVSIFVYRWARR